MNTNELIDSALNLFKSARYSEALPLYLEILKENPGDFNVKLQVGQCYRFMDNLDEAIKYIKNAIELIELIAAYKKEVQKPKEIAVFYAALGLAYQQNNQFDEAIKSLLQATKINPYLIEAGYNLAFAQTMTGELDKLQRAEKNLDASLSFLSRKMAKEMKENNSRTTHIFKTPNVQGKIWAKYVVEAAYWLTDPKENKFILFPTDEFNRFEEATETHEGLFWVDTVDTQGSHGRQFLPNYFNTFIMTLKSTFFNTYLMPVKNMPIMPMYSTILRNRGDVLKMLGRHEEANEHFQESEEFGVACIPL